MSQPRPHSLLLPARQAPSDVLRHPPGFTIDDLVLIRKFTVSGHAAVSGRSRIRSAWHGCPVTARSGGGFEGDLVAEGFELADVVALGAFRTDAGVVEAGAQVVEPYGRVAQQVPDDDQDGPADRDDRSSL